MRFLLAGLVVLSLLGCSEKDLRSALEVINASAEEQPLSEAEVVAALKDSLSRGVSRGAAIAALADGYYQNPALRIGIPPDFSSAEKTLRKIGLGGEIDRFVRQLNRSAEAAAGKAKPVFIKAITSMTIDDAFAILHGEQDAATQYLKRTTSDDLRAEFLPIVRATLDETSATRYYVALVEKYHELRLNFDVDPDLDNYATGKAIDGLFVMVAAEEANIRANPAARTTSLLRRVFGSLD